MIQKGMVSQIPLLAPFATNVALYPCLIPLGPLRKAAGRAPTSIVRNAHYTTLRGCAPLFEKHCIKATQDFIASSKRFIKYLV